MSNFNTTSINTTKTATYFTFDHINKKIVGSEFKRKKEREESILEKEVFAFIEAMMMATTKEAMKDIFKDFKIK